MATVAHEFRTPLTSLRMAIHLCTEGAVGPLTDKQADLLFAAREDCERLQTIVDDLLNLSRIESGNIDLHKRRVTPETLVDLARDAHRSAAEARQITLRSEVAPGCPEAFADPDRLELVFSNLLGNAIRYSLPESEIVVRAMPEIASAPAGETDASAGHWIRFEVSDQGPGIPQQYQAELFEKFYRVPGSPAGRVRPGPVHRPRHRAGACRPHRRGQRARQRRDLLVHRARSAGAIDVVTPTAACAFARESRRRCPA